MIRPGLSAHSVPQAMVIGLGMIMCPEQGCRNVASSDEGANSENRGEDSR